MSEMFTLKKLSGDVSDQEKWLVLEITEGRKVIFYDAIDAGK